MQVVVPGQQFVVEPRRVVAEQGLAPQFVGQQVRVEDQQVRLFGAGGVFPGQLATSDGRNVGQAGVTLMLVDEIAHVFPHHQPAEMGLQFARQPAFTAGFGAGQYHYFHACNAGSARHSRQPCTAITVNKA